MPEQTSPADEWTTVLDIAALRIEIRAGAGQPAVQQPWFDVRLHARSAPFSGTVETAWFLDDLSALRAAIMGVVAAAEEEAAWRPGDPLPDDDSAVTHVVGGNRAAELRVSGGLANSGDVLWMTLWLTPNGDDPYPALAMHLFEDRGVLTARLDALDTVLTVA
jgi:hypothetical protein